MRCALYLPRSEGESKFGIESRRPWTAGACHRFAQPACWRKGLWMIFHRLAWLMRERGDREAQETFTPASWLPKAAASCTQSKASGGLSGGTHVWNPDFH